MIKNKLNITKINYFSNTNRKLNFFVKQLLKKANRVEFINLNVSMKELFDRINKTNPVITETKSAAKIKKKLNNI
jgi:hypothetical protein